METCNVCSGACYLPSGNYEDCYSCGGRGYGATTNTPCMVCSGSGKSTTEIKDPCWNCYGTGTVSSPNSDSSSVIVSNTKNTSSEISKEKITKTQSSISDTIGGISLVVAIVACFAIYGESNDIEETIVAGVIVFFVSGFALYIAYYALKLIY